nr:class I SAM-dependent methyltransferase [Ensifer sp. ENS04]
MNNQRHEIIEAVWERHEDDAWREDQSHWRGKGRWADDARWQAIGKATVAKLRAVWRLLDKPHFPEPFVALEWGPGGGTNLFAMRRLSRRYFGVDISPSNLAECARMIGAEGYGSLFEPIHLTEAPESIVEKVAEPIDVFISTAVFQHFPSKEYGGEVLRAVKRVCKPGAVGIVQIRYDNGEEKFRPIADLSEYKEKHITANSYQIDEFWKLLRDCGLNPLMIRDINGQVNYATFFFKAP